MNSAEDRILSNMPKLLRTLQCEPLLNQDPLPSEVKREGKGVYVFYEHGKPLYVGLSDRLRGRILEHGHKSAESATFAFILTRDVWGLWNDKWKGPLPKYPRANVKLEKGSLAVTVRPTKKRYWGKSKSSKIGIRRSSESRRCKSA